MTLGQAQEAFALDAAKLILQADTLGFGVRLGEAWRSTATARIMADEGKGIANSLHVDRLAIDILLFKDGEYLTDSEHYRPLGIWWKAQSPDHAWGGDFQRVDGNHFSLKWGGRA